VSDFGNFESTFNAPVNSRILPHEPQNEPKKPKSNKSFTKVDWEQLAKKYQLVHIR
jgi:hypothetical protein